MATKLIDWIYTPEQALKIKAGDEEAALRFFQDNIKKIKILIHRRFEKLKSFTDEIFDEEDYLDEIYLRLPCFDYDSQRHITASVKAHLIYIRRFRRDYYIEKNSYYFINEDGDEIPYVDLFGKTQPFVESLDFLEKDMYGIKAIQIYDFVSQFLRTQKQKDVLLLCLEGYTYTNIMIKLDLKSNSLGAIYKQIAFNLLKYYNEIKSYLENECGLSLKAYENIYFDVKSELEAKRKKQYERQNKWMENNPEKYKEIKRKSDAQRRAAKKNNY